MKPAPSIHLGYEIGTGEPVAIPLRHLAVTGQTQESGKTTTLEALITRSKLRAIAFVTKRAEGRFTEAHELPPYFRERADWQFVAAILEATLRERLKFQRPWIMKICRGAQSLVDVQRNLRDALKKAKGLSESVYTELDEYLQIVVPQIERLPLASGVVLAPGINVMNLVGYSMEMQSLIIRSVIEWIYTNEADTITIIPEAWEFLPQQRGSPVLLAAEELIRKGGAARNYVWLDSQDLAAVHKNVLRSVGVWILGVQRESNEIKRTLAHIHGAKPNANDIASLGKGEFFVCYAQTVKRVYVQPIWLDESAAIAAAVVGDALKGLRAVHGAIDNVFEETEMEDEVTHEQAEQLRSDNERLTKQVEDLQETVRALRENLAHAVAKPEPTKEWKAAGVPEAGQQTSIDFIYSQVKARLIAEAPKIIAAYTQKHEIELHVAREKLKLDPSSLDGRMAVLISEGFFDRPRKPAETLAEFERRGQRTVHPRLSESFGRVTKLGFLTKEGEGYQAVKGMKVHIVEA